MRKYNRTFVQFKVFIDRARMYLSYINFFLLNAVFFKAFDFELLQITDQYIQFALYGMIILLGTGVLLLIGYLDHITGIRKEEMQNVAENNPFAIKVLEDLEKLKTDIRHLSEYKYQDENKLQENQS